MKIHRNKMILIVFALQLLMLLAVIAMVCAVSGRGRTVTLEMAGYDPYDALRGRYLRLSSPDSRVTLEPGSIERYENRRQSTIPVYVVLDTDPDSGISGFSYASLDCPDSNTCFGSGYWRTCRAMRVRTHAGKYSPPRMSAGQACLWLL